MRTTMGHVVDEVRAFRCQSKECYCFEQPPPRNGRATGVGVSQSDGCAASGSVHCHCRHRQLFLAHHTECSSVVPVVC